MIYPIFKEIWEKGRTLEYLSVIPNPFNLKNFVIWSVRFLMVTYASPIF